MVVEGTQAAAIKRATSSERTQQARARLSVQGRPVAGTCSGDLLALRRSPWASLAARAQPWCCPHTSPSPHPLHPPCILPTWLAVASDSEEQLLAEDERQESGVVGGPDEEEAMSSEAEDVSAGCHGVDGPVLAPALCADGRGPRCMLCPAAVERT